MQYRVSYLKQKEQFDANFCWSSVDSEIVIQEHPNLKIHLIVWNCPSCLESTSWYQNFIKWTGVLPRLLLSMGDPEKL